MLKKFVSFLLILSLITPIFYAPYQARRAEAYGIPIVDIKQIVRDFIDDLAMILAKRMVDHIVSSTVKWAQSGFEGNPAYVTNPKQYFTDIADGVAGEFIQGSDLGFLCSPFQANIRLSLTQQYYEPAPFQCSLTEIVGNIDNFYDDFSQGGWDAWFSMTQVPTNNPYGAYLAAKIELDSRLAEAVGLQKEQLNWDKGFIGWSDCEVTNPEPWVSDAGGGGTLPSRRPNPAHVQGKAVGECIKRGPTKTPGSVISDQLNQALPKGLDQLVTAQHINQLISAFAAGLLQRYVFGSKGLFARTSSKDKPTGSAITVNSRISRIDLDGDKIPEGQDVDNDQALTSAIDICFHGGTPPDCVGSVGLTTSPYLTQFCEAVKKTTGVLTDYATFMDDHADQLQGGGAYRNVIIGAILGGPVGAVFGGVFANRSVANFRDKADSTIWFNHTGDTSSAVNELLSIVRNYGISYFDPVEIAANRYSFYLDKVIESLAKDHDLDLAKFGSGGGGLPNLMKKTAYNLRYLQEVGRVMGRCEMPNAAGVGSIPLPPEEGEGGESCPGPALPVPEGSAPDMSALVVEVENSGVSPADTIAFRDAVVARLHAEDANFGYNGKRGNPDDLSTDALSYLAEGPDKPDRVFIIDFIVGSDGPNPSSGWNDVTEITYTCGSTGYYVSP